MKDMKSLPQIADDLGLPWRVEWEAFSNITSSRPSDNSPHWQIIGCNRAIQACGLTRSAAQFVANAVNCAAGGYGRPQKPRYKRGDIVRVIAPFDDGHKWSGMRIEPRCINWVGQRAVVVDVQGKTYGIYLASEGPKSYCAWWSENRLEPYSRPSKGILK